KGIAPGRRTPRSRRPPPHGLLSAAPARADPLDDTTGSRHGGGDRPHGCAARDTKVTIRTLSAPHPPTSSGRVDPHRELTRTKATLEVTYEYQHIDSDSLGRAPGGRTRRR